MLPKQSWSVFVPCFDEGENLSPVIDRIISVMECIAADYEIMIVDDGSTDNSISIIKDIERTRNNIHYIIHSANKGIGAVQRKAYTSARFENVIVIGSDGQFGPDELLQHCTVEAGTWLAFYRTRLDEYNTFRKILSVTHRLINKYVFGLELKDVNWAMAFKSEDLKKLDLRMNSTLIKTEACIKLKLLGQRVIEIPSTYHARKFGRAKGASFKIVRHAGMETIKLFFEILRFKRIHRNHQFSISDTP